MTFGAAVFSLAGLPGTSPASTRTSLGGAASRRFTPSGQRSSARPPCASNAEPFLCYSTRIHGNVMSRFSSIRRESPETHPERFCSATQGPAKEGPTGTWTRSFKHPVCGSGSPVLFFGRLSHTVHVGAFTHRETRSAVSHAGRCALILSLSQSLSLSPNHSDRVGTVLDHDRDHGLARCNCRRCPSQRP